MNEWSLNFILLHVVILAYYIFTPIKITGRQVEMQVQQEGHYCSFGSGSGRAFNKTLCSMELKISSHISNSFQTMKDSNNNTFIQKSGILTLSELNNQVNNVTLALAKYQITEAEVHVQANLGNVDWFLSKMVLFGRAISNLSQFEELSPGPVADTLFGGIVTLAREFPIFNPAKIMADPIIKELRPKVVEKCGIAEYFLEVFHARNVIRGDMLLKEFIYYENYRLLMKFEAKCIRHYFSCYQFDRIRKVVFIGSGPMPLSSIEMIRYLPATAFIVNYDHSQEAVELGAALVESQHLGHRISFVKCSALDIPDLKDADVVYLAALAGSSNIEKKKIISRFHKIMKPGSLIVARSATGLRTFLYQRLTAEDFGEFQDFRQYDPKNKVIINSVTMALKSS